MKVNNIYKKNCNTILVYLNIIKNNYNEVLQ